MGLIDEKFAALDTDYAPGQEARQSAVDLAAIQRGGNLSGIPVDFSHGDVDAFEPSPGAREAYLGGLDLGGEQAYTEYRGKQNIRMHVAEKLTAFCGAAVSAVDGLMITPGTQGALFLAIAATVSSGDKVAIVQPDYFANRKLVKFFGAQIFPVRLDYLSSINHAGIDLGQLEDAFKAGVRVLVFSNPNNPTGVVYSQAEIQKIARLAQVYEATVIVDQLYARMLYTSTHYTHLCAADINPENVITIIGPSKTESLSGYRLGVAFGSPHIIERMEKLQAIVSLRAAGYSQSVLWTWFAEPDGWISERIILHEALRDALLARLRRVKGLQARSPEAGSYLFPQLPELSVDAQTFVKLLRYQAGVTVTPGTEFGPHSSDSIRFNFSQDFATAIDAIDRVGELIERYRA